MSNYYTQFSFIVNPTNVESAAYALDIYQKAKAIRDKWYDVPLTPDQVSGLPEELRELAVLEDWKFTLEIQSGLYPKVLWFWSEDGGMDAAASFVQYLISAGHTKDAVVDFQWSHTCDRPLLDAYGGGAYVITADEQHYVSTTQWVDKKVEELKRKQKI